MSLSSKPLEPTGSAQFDCHWCAVPVAEDGRCAQCGRRQVKVCACGVELAPDAEVCTTCGAPWTGVVKVLRRKRKRGISNGVGGRGLGGALKAAAAGITITLLVAALAGPIVTRLALGSAETTQLPQTPGERLGLAWRTVASSLDMVGKAIVGRAGGIAYILALGLIGAIIGVFVYLRREGNFAPRHHDLPPQPGPRRRPR